MHLVKNLVHSASLERIAIALGWTKLTVGRVRELRTRCQISGRVLKHWGGLLVAGRDVLLSSRTVGSCHGLRGWAQSVLHRVSTSRAATPLLVVARLLGHVVKVVERHRGRSSNTNSK